MGGYYRGPFKEGAVLVLVVALAAFGAAAGRPMLEMSISRTLSSCTV